MAPTITDKKCNMAKKCDDPVIPGRNSCQRHAEMRRIQNKRPRQKRLAAEKLLLSLVVDNSEHQEIANSEKRANMSVYTAARRQRFIASVAAYKVLEQQPDILDQFQGKTEHVAIGDKEAKEEDGTTMNGGQAVADAVATGQRLVLSASDASTGKTHWSNKLLPRVCLVHPAETRTALAAAPGQFRDLPRALSQLTQVFLFTMSSLISTAEVSSTSKRAASCGRPASSLPSGRSSDEVLSTGRNLNFRGNHGTREPSEAGVPIWTITGSRLAWYKMLGLCCFVDLQRSSLFAACFPSFSVLRSGPGGSSRALPALSSWEPFLC
ncbi:hypothetical protein F4678DRAFT_481997 [Xylaria arbuscula]|nr:hypothetical protein F4678DRAFT_481997 [Xylaria arbuscula]